MALARRTAVALTSLVGLVGLVGLALTVLGAWFAVILGPHGTATFTATALEPVVIGPSTLNRVSAPAMVSATAASGPVFLGAAVPQDATDAVGQAKHEDVVVAEFPARTLRLATSGTAAMPDPSGFHVWRATGQDRLTVAQDEAPQSVLVYATKGGPVNVSVTFARSTWFLQSLVALVVGLIVMAFAGGWLWQQRRPAEATPDTGAPSLQRSDERVEEST